MKKIKTVKADKKGLQAAVAVLRDGGVLVFPTETSYGLAVDATNSKAVAKIYKIKKRAREKSLPIIVADLKMAEKYALITTLARQLARRFFPAPLTLVVRLRGKNKLAKNISSNGKIAFRVPSNEFARNLAVRLGKPITSTSANISGQKPIFSLQSIENLPANLFIDGGILPARKPSTIIDGTGKEPIVLRRGSIAIAKP